MSEPHSAEPPQLPPGSLIQLPPARPETVSVPARPGSGPRRPSWLPELSVLLRVGGALALLILLLASSWYGLSTPAHGAFGAAGSSAVHAWGALTVVRWFLLLAIAGALLSVLVPQRGMADAALVFGLIATATLAYRLLVVLPDPDSVLDVKLGGYLALLATAALTLGAYEAEASAAGVATDRASH